MRKRTARYVRADAMCAMTFISSHVFSSRYCHVERSTRKWQEMSNASVEIAMLKLLELGHSRHALLKSCHVFLLASDYLNRQCRVNFFNSKIRSDLQSNFTCHRSRPTAPTSTTSPPSRTEARPRNQRDFTWHAASLHFSF